MKYYQHISRTPLSVFVDCYVDNNLQALVIEGEVPEAILTTTWEELQSQFSQAMGSSDYRTLLKLMKEVNIISTTISQAQALIELMEHAYHEQLAILLNTVVKEKLKWSNDREIINKNLSRCRSRITAMEMHYEIKKSQLEVIEKKVGSTATTAPSRDYFDMLLNLIEEHFKVSATYELLTSRFCEKVKRMGEQLKKINGRRAR